MGRLGRLIGRVGCIYPVRRRIGHIYPLRKVFLGHGGEDKA